MFFVCVLNYYVEVMYSSVCEGVVVRRVGGTVSEVVVMKRDKE